MSQTQLIEPYPHTAKYTMWKGFLDMLPLSIAVLPWGVLCGSLAIDIGLTPWQAQCMSLFVFAGAAQLASFTLLANGSPFITIYSSTTVICSRHLLYSAVMRDHVRQMPWFTRSVFAFFLTDEMFVITTAYLEKHAQFNLTYSLFSGFSFYVFWNIATCVGIFAGQHIQGLENLGLEFAVAATFLALVIPTIRSHATACAVLASGAAVLFLEPLFQDLTMIIATLIGMFVGYLMHQEESINE